MLRTILASALTGVALIGGAAFASAAPAEDSPGFNPSIHGNKTYGPGATHQGRLLPGPYPGGRWCDQGSGVCALWSEGRPMLVSEWARRIVPQGGDAREKFARRFESRFDNARYTGGRADFEYRNGNVYFVKWR